MTAGIGYCGLDRARRPLRGSEIRGCWQGTPAATDAASQPRPAPPAPARLRGFVPLDTVRAFEIGPTEAPPASETPAVSLVEPFDRATLFDLEA